MSRVEEKALKDKALLLIEFMASDDFVARLEANPPEDETVRVLMSKLDRIYTYAHVAQNPRCIGAHNDWIKSLAKDYRRLHQAGVL